MCQLHSYIRVGSGEPPSLVGCLPVTIQKTLTQVKISVLWIAALSSGEYLECTFATTLHERNIQLCLFLRYNKIIVGLKSVTAIAL